MKKTLTIGPAVAGVLTFASTATAAHDRGSLTVGLNGAKEVGTTGDHNGSGKINLEFFDAVANPSVVFPGEHYVCYTLSTRKVARATGLHIHEVTTAGNPSKATGPVVVDLLTNSRTEGDATCVVVKPEIFDGIQADPSEYYVSLHNGDFPNGAIRGQLHAFN